MSNDCQWSESYTATFVLSLLDPTKSFQCYDIHAQAKSVQQQIQIGIAKIYQATPKGKGL